MRATILLSGGLDSTVMLAKALKEGRTCYAISFDYGQRHRIELEAAKKIATHYQVAHQIIKIDPTAFGHSSLISDTPVAKGRTPSQIAAGGIPSTYVPARNTLFLAYALCQAERLEADEIHVGYNALDYHPYPDCRPQFIRAFQELIKVATQRSLEGKVPHIVAPLITWDKAEIVQQGKRLKAPLEWTFSCYDPIEDRPCQACDACVLRNECLKAFFLKL